MQRHSAQYYLDRANEINSTLIVGVPPNSSRENEIKYAYLYNFSTLTAGVPPNSSREDEIKYAYLYNFLKAASILLANNELQSAQTILSELGAFMPGPLYHILYGDVLIAMEQFNPGLTQYQKALEHEPYNTNLLNKCLTVIFKEIKLRQAEGKPFDDLEVGKKALLSMIRAGNETKKKLADAREIFMDITKRHLIQKDIVDANIVKVEQLAQDFQEMTADACEYHAQGMLSIDKKNNVLAQFYFNLAIAAFEFDFISQTQLGFFHLQKNQLERAKNCFEKALSCSDFGNAQLGLAIYYILTEQKELARSMLSVAMHNMVLDHTKLSADDIFLPKIIELYQSTTKPKEKRKSLAYYEKEANRMLIGLKYAKALNILTEGIYHYPLHPIFYMNRSLAHSYNSPHDPDAIERAYIDINLAIFLDTSQTNYFLYQQRRKLHLLRYDSKAAIADHLMVLESAPSSMHETLSHNFSEEALHVALDKKRKGLNEESLKYFHIAEQHIHDNKTLYIVFADAFVKLGDYKAGLEKINIALKIDPNDSQAKLLQQSLIKLLGQEIISQFSDMTSNEQVSVGHSSTIPTESATAAAAVVPAPNEQVVVKSTPTPEEEVKQSAELPSGPAASQSDSLAVQTHPSKNKKKSKAAKTPITYNTKPPKIKYAAPTETAEEKAQRLAAIAQLKAEELANRQAAIDAYNKELAEAQLEKQRLEEAKKSERLAAQKAKKQLKQSKTKGTATLETAATSSPPLVSLSIFTPKSEPIICAASGIKIKIPEDIKNILTAMHGEDELSLLGGGFIRDTIHAKKIYVAQGEQSAFTTINHVVLDHDKIKNPDFDIYTSRSAQELEMLFKDHKLEKVPAVPGLYRLHRENQKPVDIFSSPDLKYSLLQFVKNKQDFCCNANFADAQGNVYDPTEKGIESIRTGQLSAVTTSAEIFRSDAIRILRGLELVVKLGMHMPAEMLKQVEKKKFLLAIQDPARVNIRLKKMFLKGFALASFQHILNNNLHQELFGPIATAIEANLVALTEALAQTDLRQSKSLSFIYNLFLKCVPDQSFENLSHLVQKTKLIENEFNYSKYFIPEPKTLFRR